MEAKTPDRDITTETPIKTSAVLNWKTTLGGFLTATGTVLSTWAEGSLLWHIGKIFTILGPVLLGTAALDATKAPTK